MAGAPIKFRCYQCNQLLGVGRAKAGGVGACPEGSAQLILPAPEPEESGLRLPGAGAESASNTEGAARDASSTVSAPAGSSPSAIDSGVDFLDIRPEDIRVEPGIAFAAPPAPSAPPPPPVAP